MQIAVTPTPTISIGSDSFDPRLTENSVLSLEVGRDRFRVLVQDKRGLGIYLNDYTFSSLLSDRSMTGILPDVFRQHPVLSAGPWQEIRIGVNSPSFTLIPAPLFRKEYAGSYLALMRGSALPAHEFAQSFAHQSEGFLSVFNLEHPLADFFSEMYPLQPLTFVHQVSALIQATADLDRHALTPDNLYLFFEDEFVTVIYRHAHQMRYCNRFGYKNVQDLTYYILYVLDEQKLNPTQTRVSLFGEITPFAESYMELSRFLPNLAFGQTPPGLSIAADFTDLPDHRYLSLYGLGLLVDK
ncbi:DUF3822 family protein [Spirosoma radiotolerans]|uniref:DUF3822 domain-containing protein n=1 Tax=Spirosoma radiotolerans TaxID=1379870 RepID=A0A0E3V7Z2_9BACT|nr:DUF3822 family protein [Spirosoma radiotolerans]AKD55861.1 hypothetical protein SD10_14095 [Spirosoma radiotolerans]